MSFLQLSAVVILVHGTFAYDVSWCKPGGDFYEALKKSAKKIGHKVIPFTWSGKLNDLSRLQAAQSLVETLASYPETEQKILVGHSHGGNVINLATQLINNSEYPTLHNAFDIESVSIKQNENLETFLEESGFVSSSDWFVKPAPFSIRTPGQLYAIDTIYLLATPVDEVVYGPCMDVVGHVFNLYSIGDYVQTVLGMYGRLYENSKRITNLQVSIKDSGIFSDDNPTHSQMHNELLAQYLFDISVPTSVSFEDELLSIHPERANFLKALLIG